MADELASHQPDAPARALHSPPHDAEPDTEHDDSDQARDPETCVIKVGGSLLDLPDLGSRLKRFIESLPAKQPIVVVGGGPAADLVRDRDRHDAIDPDRSHWLAVRAMSFNSFLLEALLDGSTVVTSLGQCQAAWHNKLVPILDPHSFLVADENASASALPHRWTVTSDTIAARVAHASNAQELVLLKSVSWSTDDWQAAAEQGVVDEHFPREAQRPPGLRVRVVNLRGQ
jgi:aspartokinase-like uncharacterized kinase